MFPLLRLHALQLRRMLGLPGFVILALAVSASAWAKQPSLDKSLAIASQVILGPLGLIAALKSDVLGWIIPTSRRRRLLSQGFFCAVTALLGALTATACLHELANNPEFLVRIGALTLSGMIGAFALGGVYLIIENDETIVGWVFLTVVGALDVGWIFWEIKVPYPPQALGILATLALVALGFYALIFFKSEWEGERPATGFVPASPQFPDMPDKFIRFTPPVHPPELVWPNKPGSTDAGQLLGISADLRKGRSFGSSLLRRGLGPIGWLLALQLAFQFLFSMGFGWVLYFQIVAFSQINQSLKTWAYFAHTPWPRWKAFAAAMAPWLGIWVALTLGGLALAPFSSAARFVSSSESSSADAPNYQLVIDREHCINPKFADALGFHGWYAGVPQDPVKAASMISELLRLAYGIKAAPEALLNLRPDPAAPPLVNGFDRQQGRWLDRIQANYRYSVVGVLLRRRFYDSLIALALTSLSVLVWVTQGAGGVLRAAASTLLMLIFFYAITFAPWHRWVYDVCDAAPLLSIPVLISVPAFLLKWGYLAFREWTPVNRKAPLHLRFR